MEEKPSTVDEWTVGEEIELTSEYIVLAIPASTCEVEINAKIYHNGVVRTVSKTMDFEEVRSAIKEAQEAYIPGDAVFSITPLGEATLRELNERYRDGLDE